ncbi:hypothetical protein KC220_25040, partial [Mycobacterium tuberculosis]|nr:hypothetical protein [Mycobacterium tuberculosis]
LRIGGALRHFHGYCDRSGRGSIEATRIAIIARESRPARAMTREERVEHIWSTTADAYRGYAGDQWPRALQGKRTVMIWSNGKGAI